MVKPKSLKSADIAHVLKSGRRYKSRSLLVFVKRIDAGEQGKIAFIAPKRLGLAVLRNRCKRLMRAGFAQARSTPVITICDYYDIILMATERTHRINSVQIAEDLAKTFAKIARDEQKYQETN